MASMITTIATTKKNTRDFVSLGVKFLKLGNLIAIRNPQSSIQSADHIEIREPKNFFVSHKHTFRQDLPFCQPNLEKVLSSEYEDTFYLPVTKQNSHPL